MSREKELAKNTAIISAGTFLPKLATFVTFPIITSNLTKGEYGIYDMLLTIMSFFMPIVSVQIHSAAFRFLIESRNDEMERRRVISNVYLFLLAPASITFLIGILGFNQYDLVTRILFLVYFFSELIVTITKQVIRGLSKTVLYSAGYIIQAIVKMMLIILFVQMMGKGFYGVLIAFIISELVCLFVLLIGGGVLKGLSINYLSIPLIKEMLMYSWPMIPNALSNWALNLSDRFVVFEALGVEAAGVYAAANKVPLVLTTVQSTFGYAWQENASLSVDDADAGKYYSSVFDMIFNMTAGATALIIAFTPILFSLLIRGDYGEAYVHIPILLIGVMFSMLATILGGVYIAYKRTKDVGITTIAAAVVNLIVDIAMVKFIGLFAASVSTLFSYFFLFAYRMFHVNKFCKMEYKLPKILGCIVILGAMGVMCAFKDVRFDAGNIVISVAFAYAINRKLIKKIVDRVLAKKVTK